LPLWSPLLFGGDHSGNFLSRRRDGAGDTLTMEAHRVEYISELPQSLPRYAGSQADEAYKVARHGNIRITACFDA
ncbi:hypothetical protein, partial [Ralstonia pseudosolanacearum]|uniref:hypothetical protein n=1 Tax=Ralstonia pseudosolanacearum TaxID=1310165 RepID=UPI001FFBE831